MPTVVIATVEGDIHDIGKNLVAMMLKNYGFKVIDLGKDVPASTIIEAVKEYKADIIALSALMTTTMQKMREVVDAVKAEGLSAQVMIGGAVTTSEYADEIHTQFSGNVGKNCMSTRYFYLEHCVRHSLNNDAFKFYHILFRHLVSLLFGGTLIYG